jgi:hypothetical protein
MPCSVLLGTERDHVHVAGDRHTDVGATRIRKVGAEIGV